MPSTPSKPQLVAAGMPTPATTADDQPKPSTINPIALVDTPLSRGIAAGRPALLLALLALRFSSLVEDPVAELQGALPVVAVVQCVYAVACLPVAGSQAAKGTTRKPRPGERTKKVDATGPSPITGVILALLLCAIVTPALYLVLVLFGAPFLDYTAHTVLCGAHFSLLALLPTVYTRGVDHQALVAVAGAAAPLDETFGALVGAAVGAWLGAVPIPLDWDRDWQRWPVTIVVGMYAGSCLGAKVAGELFYGSRWEDETLETE